MNKNRELGNGLLNVKIEANCVSDELTTCEGVRQYGIAKLKGNLLFEPTPAYLVYLPPVHDPVSILKVRLTSVANRRAPTSSTHAHKEVQYITGCLHY